MRAEYSQSRDGKHFPSLFLSRTVYYMGYRQVYTTEARTVLRCCRGWTQQPGEKGCLSGECRLRLPALPSTSTPEDSAEP